MEMRTLRGLDPQMARMVRADFATKKILVALWTLGLIKKAEVKTDDPEWHDQSGVGVSRLELKLSPEQVGYVFLHMARAFSGADLSGQTPAEVVAELVASYYGGDGHPKSEGTGRYAHIPGFSTVQNRSYYETCSGEVRIETVGGEVSFFSQKWRTVNGEEWVETPNFSTYRIRLFLSVLCSALIKVPSDDNVNWRKLAKEAGFRVEE